MAINSSLVVDIVTEQIGFLLSFCGKHEVLQGLL